MVTKGVYLCVCNLDGMYTQKILRAQVFVSVREEREGSDERGEMRRKSGEMRRGEVRGESREERGVGCYSWLTGSS